MNNARRKQLNKVLDLLEEARCIIENLPSAQPENQVHLCDSCRHVYPECPSGKDDVIFGNGKGNDNICACNKYEPSAQPEPPWIPCKERLPKKEIDVLCCRDNKTMAIMHFNPVLTTRYPKGFSVVEDAFSWRQDNVVAWMPMPESYREEGEV